MKKLHNRFKHKILVKVKNSQIYNKYQALIQYKINQIILTLIKKIIKIFKAFKI